MFDLFNQEVPQVFDPPPILNPENVYDVRYEPANSKLLVYEADSDIYNLVLARDFELFLSPHYDSKRLHTIMSNIYAQKVLRVYPSESRAIVRNHEYDADKEMLRFLNPDHIQEVFDATVNGASNLWDPNFAAENGVIVI